jgi:hypothetical protein
MRVLFQERFFEKQGPRFTTAPIKAIAASQKRGFSRTMLFRYAHDQLMRIVKLGVPYGGPISSAWS